MTIDPLRAPMLVLMTAVLIAGSAGCSGTDSGPVQAVLPANSSLVVVLDSPLNSAEAEAGSLVGATLAHSVLVDGRAVIAAGTPVSLEVVRSQAAGEDTPAVLTLQLAGLSLPSGPAALPTHPVEIVGQVEPESAASTDTDSGQLESEPGAVVVTQAAESSVQLAAGQRLEFSTSSEFRVPLG